MPADWLVRHNRMGPINQAWDLSAPCLARKWRPYGNI